MPTKYGQLELALDARFLAESCRWWESCRAPLCVMDPHSLQYCVWHSDEEICRKNRKPYWVNQQRLIAKRGDNGIGPFTVRMLRAKCTARDARGRFTADSDALPTNRQTKPTAGALQRALL
jgi:hypothetical protein